MAGLDFRRVGAITSSTISSARNPYMLSGTRNQGLCESKVPTLNLVRLHDLTVVDQLSTPLVSTGPLSDGLEAGANVEAERVSHKNK